MIVTVCKKTKTVFYTWIESVVIDNSVIDVKKRHSHFFIGINDSINYGYIQLIYWHIKNGDTIIYK